MSKQTVCDQCGKQITGDNLLHLLTFDVAAIQRGAIAAPEFDFCRTLCLARWAKAEHVRTRKPREKRVPKERAVAGGQVSASPSPSAVPPKRKRGRPKKVRAAPETTQEPAGEPTRVTVSNQGALPKESLIEPCPHCGESLVGNRILSDKGDGRGPQETCLNCMQPIPKLVIVGTSQ